MAVVKNLMVRIGADTSGIVKGMKDAWKSTWVSSDKIKQATSGSAKAVAAACKSSGSSMRSYKEQVKKLKEDHAAAMDGVTVYSDKLKRLKETYDTIKNATDGLDLTKSLAEQMNAAGAELDELEIKIEKTKRKIASVLSGKMSGAKNERLETLKIELAELMYQSDRTAEHYRALEKASKNVGAENMGMASAAGLKKLAAEIAATEAKLNSTQGVVDKTAEKLSNIGGNSVIAGIKRIGSAAAAAAKAGVKGLGKSLGNLAKDGIKGLASIPGKLLRIGKSASSGSNGVQKMLSSIKRLGAVSLGLKVASGLFGRLRSVVSGYVSQNEALNNTVTQLKDQLGQALAPAINVVISAMQTIMPLVQRVSGMISSVLSAIGGKLAATTAEIQKTADEAADAADGMYGFDQITKESDDTSSSTTSTPVADVQAPAGLLSWIDQLKNAFAEKDWKGIGAVAAGGLNDIVNAFDASSISSKIGTVTQNVVDAVSGFFDRADFGSIGAKAGQLLTSSFKEINWSQVGNTIGKALTAIPEMIVEFAMKTDWAVVGQSVSDLLINGFKSIGGWIEKVDWQALGTKAADFVKNIDWNGLSDAIFEAIGAAFGAIGAFCKGLLKDAFDGLANWWKTNALNEEGKFTVAGFFNGIADAFKNIGKWVMEHIFQPLIDGFRKAFGIHSPASAPELLSAAGFVGEGILNGIGNAFKSIGAWVKTKIVEPISNKIAAAKDTWGDIKASLKMTVETKAADIKAKWKELSASWADKTAKFGLKFSAAADNLKSWVNENVIDRVNGIWSSVPILKNIKIPHLATGMVATKPTVAMFGEAGAEAVVPLENNTGWIRKVAAELDANRSGGGTGEGLALTIPIYIGGRKIVERVIDGINDITKTTGTCPIKT